MEGLSGLIFRHGLPGKAVSNRKQTARGDSGLNADAGFESCFRKRQPDPPPSAWTGENQRPGPFPETNIAGTRQQAACACALNGGT